MKPLLSRGQALVIANQPDGILALSNTSIPAGGSTMAGVSTVAVLAGFALPVFNAARVRAVEVNDMNKLRQINLGLNGAKSIVVRASTEVARGRVLVRC